MRILYVIPRFPSPSETFVSQEVLGIRQRGHDVLVAAFRGPDDAERAKLSPAIRELAEQTHYLSGSSLLGAIPKALLPGTAVAVTNRRLAREATIRSNPTMRLIRTVAVARLAQRHRCEHIHAHWPLGAQVTAVEHAMTGIPYSVSIHAHEVAHDNGHFPAIFETVSFASFCNKAAMEYLLSRLPADARSKSHLIYHGVDLEAFSFSPVPPINGVLRVVSAGRLTATKGFERLVRAVRHAADHNHRVELTIVGDGGLRERLQLLAAELGVSDRLTITGWVPHTHVAEYLRNAHVFALLADDTFNDGLPNVVIEAMAVGRPVILSPLPAASEAVEPGRNGWVLSKVDAPDELAQRWGELLKTPQLLDAMASEARAFAERNHDRRVHLDRLDQLFRSRSAGK